MLLLHLLFSLLEVLGALCLDFLKLGCRLADLLIHLLKLDTHANSSLNELAHIII